MQSITSRVAAVGIAALALLGTMVLWQPVKADTPETIELAIPHHVAISFGQTQVILTGRSPGGTPTVVNCTSGTPWPQAAVVIDPGSGEQTELTGILVYHDHELPIGSRYLITGGPAPCNTEVRLVTATRL